MLTLTVGLASAMVVERVINNAAVETVMDQNKLHDQWAKAQVDSILRGLASLTAPSCTVYVPIAVPPLSLDRIYGLMDSLSTTMISQKDQVSLLTQLVINLDDSVPQPSLYIVLDQDTVVVGPPMTKLAWKWYWPLPRHDQPQQRHQRQ